MALVTCAAEIAANIAQDCNNPIVSGFTGRGVLIPADKVALTKDASNPRKIEAISLVGTGTKLCAIDDIFETPFDGTNVASASNNGLVNFNKNVGVHIPLRGAAASKDIVEPLLRSRVGFVAVLERKDKIGDGSYVVIGAQSALKANADGITQDEAANGGAWMATLSCSEPWAESTLAPTPEDDETAYEAAKAAFETLLTNAF